MNSTEKQKINATIIIEILGKPKEHLVETLNKLVEKFSEEKGIKVLEKKVNEPVQSKNHPEFFSSFAELSFEAEEIMYLIAVLFKYMPSHVEIVSPQNVNLSNSGWTEVLSEITRKLHAYEEVVRVAQTEKVILERKLKESMEMKKPSVDNSENAA